MKIFDKNNWVELNKVDVSGKSNVGHTHVTTDITNYKKPQSKTVDVPALVIGIPKPIDVTWDFTFASVPYVVVVTPLGTTTTLGKLNWSVVDGSITVTGCQIVVSSLIALTLGQMRLQVSAFV